MYETMNTVISQQDSLFNLQSKYYYYYYFRSNKFFDRTKYSYY